MNDDERIERLTELARRVWPNRSARVAVSCEDDEWPVCVLLGTEDEAEVPMGMDHPCALDMLEAALLVMADQPIPTDANDRFVGGGARPAYDAKGGERG